MFRVYMTFVSDGKSFLLFEHPDHFECEVRIQNFMCDYGARPVHEGRAFLEISKDFGEPERVLEF